MGFWKILALCIIMVFAVVFSFYQISTADAPMICEGSWSWGGMSDRVTLNLFISGERVYGTVDIDNPRLGPRYGIKAEGTLKDGRLLLKFPEIAFGGVNATLDGDKLEGWISARTGTSVRLSATCQ